MIFLNQRFQLSSRSSILLKSQGSSPTRAVASGGGGGGGQLPPPPWTCWARHIKSVDGLVFFRLSYSDYSDLQLFAIFIFEVDFSETYFLTSAKKSVSEPPNLKIFGGRMPLDPLRRFVPSALTIIPPRYKKPSYGPANIFNSSKGIYFLIRPLDLMALDFLHILLICSVKTRFYPWWHPNSWLLFSLLFRC